MKEYLPYVIILILVLLIKQFVVTPIRVNGTSMADTLHNGDIMILNETSYYFDSPKRFDIVVVKYQNEYLIKRVIGLPGEVVEYKDNKLYIDGKFVEEKFYHEATEDFKIEALGDSKYFVLGDNRINSMDSRMIGPVSKKTIRGKTSFTIFPFKRFGKKN